LFEAAKDPKGEQVDGLGEKAERTEWLQNFVGAFGKVIPSAYAVMASIGKVNKVEGQQAPELAAQIIEIVGPHVA
jgi:hypothetical protein